MRNKWLLIIIMVALLCTVGWVGRAQMKGPDKATWEYQVSFAHAIQAGDMNRLGADGWELAAVTCQEGNQCAYFFKRRR
jgi:hypothetical protein